VYPCPIRHFDKNIMSRIITLLVFVLSLTLASNSFAVEPATVNKQDAAVAAMQHIPGKVVSVNLEQQHKTPVYRVKVLDERGGMHTVIIHGQTGEILSAY